MSTASIFVMSQLTNYIQKELDKGFSKKLITKKLLQAGYDTKEIKESFKSLHTHEPLIRRELDHTHYDVHIQWSKWVFPLLAVCVALFLGYLVFMYATQDVSFVDVVDIVDDKEVGCATLSSVPEQDICFLRLAAQGEDVCDQLSSTVFGTACDEAFWDTNVCLYEQLIEDVGEECTVLLNENVCRDAEDVSLCLGELAVSKKDATLCDGQISCLVYYAVEMNDGSVCTEYASTRSTYCTARYYEETGDASYCEVGSISCGYDRGASDVERAAFIEKQIAAFDDKDSGELLLGFAVQEGDPLVCTYLGEDDEKYHNLLSSHTISFTDFCVLAVAFELADSSICDTLTESYKYALCQDILTCPNSENEAICNELV
jgi:hypothetical protein